MQVVSSDIVESYIVEVCRFVPDEQRDEIAEDLRSAIAEEVYELADERGEDPSGGDAQQVLARFGHPLRVAARYQPQKYLIGPDIYPAMMQTMRVVLAFALGAQVIVIYLLGQAQDWQIGPWALFWQTIEFVIWVAIAVFLVFVAIEYSGEKLGWYERWSPKTLSPNSVSTISRSDVVTDIISEGFFLLWWNGVLVLKNYVPDQSLTVHLAEVWDFYFWPLNVVFFGLFVLHVYTLMMGVWHRWALLAQVFLCAALIGLGAVLLSSESLLVIEGTLIHESLAETIARTVLLVIIGFTAWDVWAAISNLRGRIYGQTNVEMSTQAE